MIVFRRPCAHFLRDAVRATATTSNFRQAEKVDGVTLVTDAASAEKALSVLNRCADAVVAWDTETAGVNLNLSLSQSRLSRVVCATAYCGDDVDFGNGPRLLVDNVGPDSDPGLLQMFRDYFQDPTRKKVFHNYTFDRHMLKTEGCELRGLEADTLILARIHDTAKGSWEGAERQRMDTSQKEAAQAYERSKLAPTFAVKGLNIGGQQIDVKAAACLHTVALPVPEDQIRAPPVVTGYGYDLKNLATSFELMDEGQKLERFPFGACADAALRAFTSPEQFSKFVEYATLDAVLTWRLFQHLKLHLTARPWFTEVHKPSISQLLGDDSLADAVADELRSYRPKGRPFSLGSRASPRGSFAGTPGTVQLQTGKTMWDFFQQNLKELPECLAKMQDRGIAVDTATLDSLATRAEADRDEKTRLVRETLMSIRKSDGSPLNEDLAALNIRSSLQLRTLLFGGVRNKKNFAEVLEVTRSFPCTQGSGKRTYELSSLGLEPGSKKADFTLGGWPSTNRDTLSRLRDADEVKFQMDDSLSDEAKATVETALDLLSECRQIQSSIGQLKPLRDAATEGRIHPSWQFNTSTGRLTCSKPNLQSLVAGPKDMYGIRAAFRAKPGCKLILADYSQLELRILAHVSKCRKMAGGLLEGQDFHGQVAAEMFPHVAEAVEKGDVNTLDGGIQSVKSVFPEERKRAKAVNFGIIYGLGDRSLAEDLNIPPEEAARMTEAWFAGKPAVRSWKHDVEQYAEKKQISHSLLGRERHLPLLDQQASAFYRGKAKRAAVNFAIQGSAADIVTAAMLQLERRKDLAETGFCMIMQVHDEIVLEGPEQRADQAAEILREAMKKPFQDLNPSFEFRVPLEVDITIGDTLQAKG